MREYLSLMEFLFDIYYRVFYLLLAHLSDMLDVLIGFD